jgi:hypothetical protein
MDVSSFVVLSIVFTTKVISLSTAVDTFAAFDWFQFKDESISFG